MDWIIEFLRKTIADNPNSSSLPLWKKRLEMIEAGIADGVDESILYYRDMIFVAGGTD